MLSLIVLTRDLERAIRHVDARKTPPEECPRGLDEPVPGTGSDIENRLVGKIESSLQRKNLQ